MKSNEERKAEVLQEVSQMIREVIGEAWAQDAPITMATSFAQDLQVESIELVALSEKLTQRYGATVDFPGWLAGMELDAIIGLTVGQVVDFIASCPSKE
jgi:acyl carrier protein